MSQCSVHSLIASLSAASEIQGFRNFTRILTISPGEAAWMNVTAQAMINTGFIFMTPVGSESTSRLVCDCLDCAVIPKRSLSFLSEVLQLSEAVKQPDTAGRAAL